MKRTLIKVTLLALLAALLAGLWVCAAQADAEHTHKWTLVATRKAPTCTQAGTGLYRCSCGTQKTDTIPATGHKWGKWEITRKATCAVSGIQTRKCSVCGAKENKYEPKLKTHNWGAWQTVKAAACEAAGEQTRACKDCKKKETKALPALGHDWDEGVITTPAGFLENGVKTYTCRRCGATKTEEVPVQSTMNGSSIMDLLRNGPTETTFDENKLRIVKQPEGGFISKDGGSLLLSVEAEGGQPPYTYEWRRKYISASAWTSLMFPWRTVSEGESNTCDADLGNYRYYCRVYDNDGHRVNSDEAVVGFALYIDRQPQNANLYGQDAVNLYCTAAGGVPFGADYTSAYVYYWYDGSGENVGYGQVCSADHEGEYYCIAEDAASAQTTSATVTVYSAEPLTIQGLPDEVMPLPGEGAELAATVAGGVEPYAYEWFYKTGEPPFWINDSDRAGDGASISVPDGKRGWYRFTVTDSMGEEAYQWVQVKKYVEPLTIVRTEFDSDITNAKKASIFVEVTDGTDPYTYTLLNDGTEQDSKSSHGTSASFSIDEPGWYAIHIEDAEGRTAETQYMEVGDYRLEIVKQPQSVTLYPDPDPTVLPSATFTCLAHAPAGHSLLYTWQQRTFGGWQNLISGSTRTTLTQSDKKTDTTYYHMAHAYRCIVKDLETGEEVTSKEAKINWPMTVTGRQDGKSCTIIVKINGGKWPYSFSCYRRRYSFYRDGGDEYGIIQEEYDLTGHINYTGGDLHHSAIVNLTGLSKHAKNYYSAQYNYAHYAYYITVTDATGNSKTVRVLMTSDQREFNQYARETWYEAFIRFGDNR